ncbi:MAG: multidrug transporter, partial [Hyphomicrobiales bacterium]
MIGKRSIVLAVVALSVAGCTMIPEYTRPEPPVPSQWPTGPAYKEPAAAPAELSAPDLAWRDYFPDPRLQILIETGLKNNRDLRAAALNVDRARAFYRIQQVEILPVIDATGRLLDQRVPGTINGNGRSVTLK